MATDTWDPRQYEKFRREREQPFLDLFALIQPTPSMRIVDLGCGTGRLTRSLHELLHARETVGVDRSERMLVAARSERPPEGLRFEAGTVELFAPDGLYDLVFSNAVYHWIEAHDALIPKLVEALTPGGQIACQVPAMHRHPSHVVADDLAAGQFRDAFGGWRRPQPVLEPEDYARLLFRAGIAQPKVRTEIYPHVLGKRDDVVDWMKGTQPFFFPFRRILCWGRRAN